MDVEERLKAETKKWMDKLEEKLKIISGDRAFLENINAYLKDSKYFFDKGDFVRSFEAVVWSWAWLEIGLEIGKLSEKS